MFTKDNAAQFGRKGAAKVLAKYGREHMSKIGRKGFEATTNRHFQGDESKHKEYLSEQCRWNYYVQTGLPLKRQIDGRPVWRKPVHPAHLDNDPIPF